MKLLVVEDSTVLGASLVRGLTAEGFTVDLSRTGEEALQRLALTDYDALVLDWMLPGLSGLDVLERLRDELRLATPVLLLSARSEVHDRIRGLDIGADDYLPKPFDFAELVARVRALARRGPTGRAPTLRVGALEIDTSSRAVRAAGRPLELTRSEYRILEALATRRGAVLSKEWLLERLHDSESFAGLNVIEVFVSSLRRKLRAAGAGDPIETRRGHGYVIAREDAPSGPGADA